MNIYKPMLGLIWDVLRDYMLRTRDENNVFSISNAEHA